MVMISDFMCEQEQWMKLRSRAIEFCVIYSRVASATVSLVSTEKLTIAPRALIFTCESRGLMGDKSPKATNKQASQKQAKANVNNQNKKAAAAAKQAPAKPKK